MSRDFDAAVGRKSIAFLIAVCMLLLPAAPLFAQDPQPPANPPTTVGQPSEPRQLSPDELDNLVAPMALYPDPLLSQVLAASTYPLEIVEAQQWLQQNQNLKGQQLMDAARQQNWDPSVQALVAFPDALTLLNRDVQWTTDLGNAFLAQQNDVMAAIQRMRRRAQQNGKLTSTAQETVNTQTEDGQSAIQIQPANPQVIYVPVYNPVYVWGPPAWGYYPPLGYPGVGFGFGFGPGIYLGGFFPGWGIGWGGWGVGWGWGFGWFGGGLYVNPFFFNHWGFYHGGYYGYAGGARQAWAHDSFHRQGVGYANASVAARYNNSRFAAGRYAAGSTARSSATGGWRSFNNSGSSASRAPASSYRGSANSFNRGSAPATNYGRSSAAPSYNRNANPGYNRSYAAPNSGRSYSAPSSSAPGYRGNTASPNYGARNFSSPRSFSGGSAGGSRPSSGGFSGGHSSGGGARGRR